MKNTLNKVIVMIAAAGTGIVIDNRVKRPTGSYPNPAKIGVAIAGTLATMYVGAFLEQKLNVTD
jgi:hypothetical protein